MPIRFAIIDDTNTGPTLAETKPEPDTIVAILTEAWGGLAGALVSSVELLRQHTERLLVESAERQAANTARTQKQGEVDTAWPEDEGVARAR